MHPLTRRIFLSGLGAVYLIAFVSLWMQIQGLVGEDGILPASRFLADVSQQVGGRPFARIPTLCWFLGATDATLHALCAAGVIGSVLLIAGFFPAPIAAALWLLYLSLFTIGREFLSFQWDILLLESGFLAIFCAPPLALHPASRGWSAPPSRIITWLLRLLLFKMMFLSGVVKLASGDPTWWNLTALSYHYETTCLPTWTGWYAHHAPPWAHRFTAALTFAVELLVPFFVFGPRRLRFTAAAAFASLMIAIAATGNYGFFNLLSIVLCIPLLDDEVWPEAWRARARRCLPELRPAAPAARSWPLALTVPLVLAIGTLTMLPLVGSFRVRVAWPAPVLRLYEIQSPFHVVNGYGLFARMTTERPEIVIEGSDDGETWRAYEFRWKPGDPQRRPRFVQPHMPRLDWRMWFAALGSIRTDPWILAFCHKLLLGSPSVLGLLADNPFSPAPPKYLRATLYDYEFTTPEERERTGAWWHRQRLRPYTPVLFIDPADPDTLLGAGGRETGDGRRETVDGRR